MRVKIAWAGALVLSVSLIGCSGGSSSVMGGKFSSLQQCLSSIQSSTGMAPRPVTDTPTEVSGYLGSTKRDFACSKRSTGTQGVVWEGWYEAD